MISMEVTNESINQLMSAMQSLNSQAAYVAIGRAAKRAATAARTAGTKQVRQIYTIKSGDLKKRAQIKQEAAGATIEIKGARESVKKYQARQNRKGIYAVIKRGQGGQIARSFAQRGKFMRRTTESRLPVSVITSPAVPQLFGNPEVLKQMENRGLEVFSRRLLHEFGRMAGIS